MSMAEVRDVAGLIEMIWRGARPSYVFFWSHVPSEDGILRKECLSQWWPAPFEVEQTRYPTAEHYMMAEKARLFGDYETLTRILKAGHPAEVKKLGREVRGFESSLWGQHCVEIVTRGNQAKFGQNEDLRRFLLQTGEKVLVEASPKDSIWGIGLDESDARSTDPEQWPGRNLLGFALMEVRSRMPEATCR